MVLFKNLVLFALTCSVAFAQAPAELSAVDAAYPLGPVLAPVLDDPVLNQTTYAVQVVNLRTGEEVFARNGNTPMVPASVNKVLTAALALKTLGPGHVYKTEVSTDGTIGADGTLTGNLYVRGSGDPTLVSEKLTRLVADLPLMGIERIQGDVVFDDSYFDQSWLTAGWSKGHDIRQGPAYFAPMSALGVNFGTTCIVVAPAATTGAKARAVFETPIPMLSMTNEVKTGTSRSRTRIEVLRTVTGDKVHFKLTGTIKKTDKPNRIYKSIASPQAFFRQMFKVEMDLRGVKVSGAYRHGKTPKGTTSVTSLSSDTISIIVGKMNKWSSNYMAEAVLKTVGAEVSGRPGTTAKGVAQMEKMLVKMGNTSTDFRVVNGSGLSRQIKMSASLVNSLMVQLYWDDMVGPEFLSSMSIGGEDGTLRYRFRDKGQSGRVRGKTGSLSGIYTLTAFINGGDGEVYVMTFLTNGIKGGSRKVRNLQDRFAAKILALPAK